MKIKTYKVTVSVPGNVDRSIADWLCKTYGDKGSFLLVEEHGESGMHAHLHALMYFEEGLDDVAKRQWKRRLFKKVQEKHPSARAAHAVVMNVQHDHKWYDEYLRKEEGYITHADNYDRELVESAFPTTEQQEELQSASKACNSNSMWIDLCKGWEEYGNACDPMGAVEYLNYRMHYKRDLPVIADDRFRRQKAIALYEFRVRRVRVSTRDEKWLSHVYEDEYVKDMKRKRTDEYLSKLKRPRQNAEEIQGLCERDEGEATQARLQEKEIKVLQEKWPWSID